MLWAFGSMSYFPSILRSPRGVSWPWSHVCWIYNYLCNQCLSPLMLWVWLPPRARCTTLCDVCQRLAAGRWFSLGPPVSSNKTDRHDIGAMMWQNSLLALFKQILPSCDFFWTLIIFRQTVWHNLQLVEGCQYLVQVVSCCVCHSPFLLLSKGPVFQS